MSKSINVFQIQYKHFQEHGDQTLCYVESEDVAKVICEHDKRLEYKKITKEIKL